MRSQRDPDGVATAIHLVTGIRAGPLAIAAVLGAVASTIALAVPAGPAIVVWLVRAAVWAVAALPIGILAIATIKALAFRSWRARLPFALTGDWAQLAGDRRDASHFRRCAIEIELVDPARDGGATAAALSRFATEATSQLWLPRFGFLREWRTKGWRRAEGDANATIAWTIYRLLARDLPRVAAVRGVHLTCGEPRSVRAQSTWTVD